MIRFILRRESLDQHSGLRSDDYETMDLEVPELEAVLLRCGFGESGFDRTVLVGVEVRQRAQEASR